MPQLQWVTVLCYVIAHKYNFLATVTVLFVLALLLNKEALGGYIRVVLSLGHPSYST